MAREQTATLDGVIVGYGTRDSINVEDAVVHTLGRVSQLEVTVDVSNYLTLAEAVAPSSKQFAIPAGSVIQSVTVTTANAWNTLTSVAMGLKDATSGAQLHGGDDVLVTDVEGILAVFGAGDYFYGAGALADGTTDIVTTADSVLSFTVTGSAPTTGQSTVLIEYVEPVPSSDAPAPVQGVIGSL